MTWTGTALAPLAGVEGDCPPATLSDWTQRTGIALLEGFGMSECLACTFTSVAEPVPGSAGKALPGVEIAIVDSLDKQVPSGTRGDKSNRGTKCHIGCDGCE